MMAKPLQGFTVSFSHPRSLDALLGGVGGALLLPRFRVAGDETYLASSNLADVTTMD